MGNDITSNITRFSSEMFVSKEGEEERLRVMAAKFPKGRIAIALKNVLFRFGTAQLIRTFSLTCKDYKLYCDRSLVWRTALYMDISSVLVYTLSEAASDSRAVDWKKAYKAALFEKCKSECHHMLTLQKAMKAVQDYQGCRLAEKDDIIGLVADMVMFDDPDVARCLSEKRQQGLNMLLMKDRDAMVRFKHSRDYGVLVPYDLAFMTMDTDFAAIRSNVTEYCDVKNMKDLPKIRNEPNFLGYAIHLVRLRPEHEYLRSSFLFSMVFLNLMVFRTSSSSSSLSFGGIDENNNQHFFTTGTCKYAADYETRNPDKKIWTVGLDYTRTGSTGRNYDCDLCYASRIFRPLSQDSDTECIETRLSKIGKTQTALAREKVSSFLSKQIKRKRRKE